MAYFTTLLLSMFVTIGLIPILCRVAVSVKAVDYPNERKMHTMPIPRIGGLAMAIGVLLPFLLQNSFNQFSLAILLGALVIVVFGMVDDLIGLRPRVKFCGQIAASLVVVVYGDLEISTLGECLPEQCRMLPWIAVPLTLLTLVGVTNAINLADGLDGLAGGMMLQVFICISLLGYCSGDLFTTLLSVAVVGAIFGFLRFNTHPATIFMGDTGSQLIGFLAISLALGLTQGNKALSPLMPLLLLGFPVLDTAVVMGERIRNNKSPFKADKSHFHHKLIELGLYHSEAVFVLYAIQAVFVATAYMLRFYSEWTVLGAFIFLVLFLLCPIYYASSIGVRLQRTGVVDVLIKSQLRRIVKETSLVLKCGQKTIENGIPLIFLFAVFIPASIPSWFSISSGILLCCVAVAVLFRSAWVERLIRVFLYGLLPLVLFQSMQQVAPWMGHRALQAYTLSYAIVAFATVMVLKLTRRKQGFRMTPTDFLIVILALVLPNLSIPAIESLHLGFWGTCLIVCFFTVEVLMGELRHKTGRLALMLLPTLGVLTVRGLI